MNGKILVELKTIVGPFLAAGIYKTEEEALEHIVEDLVEVKIEKYKKEIRTFEDRYKMPFSKFSELLKNGKVSIEKEDEWMEWEAAINMLHAWEEVKKNLVYAN